jgi:hypothetical protein
MGKVIKTQIFIQHKRCLSNNWIVQKWTGKPVSLFIGLAQEKPLRYVRDAKWQKEWLIGQPH